MITTKTMPFNVAQTFELILFVLVFTIVFTIVATMPSESETRATVLAILQK